MSDEIRYCTCPEGKRRMAPLRLRDQQQVRYRYCEECGCRINDEARKESGRHQVLQDIDLDQVKKPDPDRPPDRLSVCCKAVAVMRMKEGFTAFYCTACTKMARVLPW